MGLVDLVDREGREGREGLELQAADRREVGFVAVLGDHTHLDGEDVDLNRYPSTLVLFALVLAVQPRLVLVRVYIDRHMGMVLNQFVRDCTPSEEVEDVPYRLAGHRHLQDPAVDPFPSVLEACLGIPWVGCLVSGEDQGVVCQVLSHGRPKLTDVDRDTLRECHIVEHRESHNDLGERLEDRTVAGDRGFEVFGTVHNLQRRSAFSAKRVLKEHSQDQSQEHSSVEDNATGEDPRAEVEADRPASTISTWSFRCYQIL